MRKKIGVVLVALGVFMLVLAALSRYYAYDQLAVAPLDRNASTAEGATDHPTVSEGRGTIFSVAAGLQEIETDVTSTRNTVGQVSDSEELSDATGDRLAIYETFSYTQDGEGRVLSGTFDRVIFDRVSGQAVHCPEDLADLCDEKTGSSISEAEIEQMMQDAGTEDLTKIFGSESQITYRHPGEDGFNGFEGQYFKMPVNTQKQTYQWWDGSLGRATDMVYQDTEDINGLETYRFEQVIPPTDIADQELPASVTGFAEDVVADRMYSNTRTVWIEPETGAVIKAQEDQLTTFDYEGEPVVTATDVTIGYNDDTVANNIDDYQSLSEQLRALRVWIPLGGLILGVVLLAVGVLLIVLAHRRRTPSDATT